MTAVSTIAEESPLSAKTPVHLVVVERLAEMKKLQLAGPRTIGQLADNIGVNRSHLHRELAGTRPLREDREAALASALGLTLDEFKARLAAHEGT